MKEVTINNQVYRIGRLDAFKQLHVTRRVLPILGPLGLFSMVKEGAADIFDILAGPFIHEMSEMKDENLNYVIDTCLAVCERKQMNGGLEVWGPVVAKGTTASGNGLMFNDLQGSNLLQLTWEVLQENLSDFFLIGQSISQPADKVSS